MLSWVIPLQVDETGGTPITAFLLQYTVEDSADFSPGLATWCTTEDGPPPCETANVGAGADGVLGRVSGMSFRALKGTIYHFRIAAINKMGQGPWSSESSFGTTKTEQYFTTPPQPPAPTVVPKTDTNMNIDWSDYDSTCRECYESKTINGGRSLTHLELNMRINSGPWFLYGEQVTNIPECNDGGDCIFRHYIVPAPGGLLRQKDLNFQQKRIEVLASTMSQRGFYEFRLRSSNDNMTSWSPWSPTGFGTTFLPIINNVQVSGFPHVFAGMPTPTTMTLRWYQTYDLPDNLLAVDYKVIYGYSEMSVYWGQVATSQADVGASDKAPSFASVSNLIPDTTYHFKVCMHPEKRDCSET